MSFYRHRAPLHAVESSHSQLAIYLLHSLLRCATSCAAPVSVARRPLFIIMSPLLHAMPRARGTPLQRACLPPECNASSMPWSSETRACRELLFSMPGYGRLKLIRETNKLALDDELVEPLHVFFRFSGRSRHDAAGGSTPILGALLQSAERRRRRRSPACSPGEERGRHANNRTYLQLQASESL